VTKRRDERRTLERSTEGSHLWPDAADRTSGLRPRRRSSADDALDGQYRLLGPLGESAYGRAYLAEQLTLGRTVAVHFIPEGSVSERVLSRELPLAVAKCAQLSHPNVVSLHAYGRTDGQRGMYYVVTDLLEGISLEEYLNARGPLAERRALGLIRQIGRALRAAHKLSIFHGDLRPANVQAIEVDDRAVLKVVGFGKLPLLVRGDESASPNRNVSSPNYAAPEFLRGDPVDARTDVYALGAILFRMIAGAAPYPGSSSASVLEAMKSSPAPSLRARLGDAVSHELDGLVMRMLAVNPADRFADVVTAMRAMRFLFADETDFLSREIGDVSVVHTMPGPQSILPSVSPATDVTGARQAMLAHEGAKARTRIILLAIGIVLALGVIGEVWLGAKGPRHGLPTKSRPAASTAP
jgi:serine/threonine protein kinase